MIFGKESVELVEGGKTSKQDKLINNLVIVEKKLELRHSISLHIHSKPLKLIVNFGINILVM